MSGLYVHRTLEGSVRDAAANFPVVVVSGVRQAGKSTLLRHMFGDYDYLTLDDPVSRRSAQDDPGLLLDSIARPLIIDEVQYAPEVLPYIKMEVDADRRSGGQFLLSGSQTFPLFQGLGETLAGRAALFELLGMSLSEVPIDNPSARVAFERIFTGSYPDPLLHHVDCRTFYSSYVQTYVERDIRQVDNVRDAMQFHSFLEVLAARVGGLLNLSALGAEVGVSHTTARRWLSLLETSRVIYLLRPYHANLQKRLTRSPKLYFLDTGLLTYLLRYPDSRTLAAGPQAGAVFENFVVTEVLKEKIHRNAPFELYFYRDRDGLEADLLLDFGSRLVVGEIKLARTVTRRHWSALERIGRHLPHAERVLISCYERPAPLAAGVRNVPVNDVPSLARV